MNFAVLMPLSVCKSIGLREAIEVFIYFYHSVVDLGSSLKHLVKLSSTPTRPSTS